MKRSFFRSISLLLGIVILMALASPLNAQKKEKAPKPPKAPKTERLSGTIQMINKDTSVITLRTKGNINRYVVYSNETQFTYRNKPGSLDDVKDGRRVICLGKYDDKARLVATRVDVREGK
ncbi:MAG TPA: hypothetical protein VGQ81_11965 [Acidobacteriota bacterium]|jgi:hypothetical protein|nr:hypothetical protein [Acidobacteriota bacterium]